MELEKELKVLAERIGDLKEKISTEEATKTAFILPFIKLLGYDIFNPTEVVPEFTADLGLKKGEKVDYAIFQDGDPILIIECKHWKQNLDVHDSQLFRYFHVSKTRFSLLTNGIEYRFYSDIEEENKMDEKPFLVFSMEDLRDSTINEIAKFHKSNFDVEKIINNASSLKYMNEIKKLLDIEFSEPTHDFVRLFASQVYSGRLTERVMEQFTKLVKRVMSQFINERVNNRLTTALNKEEEQQQKDQVLEEDEEEEPRFVTTEEELEGYRIVVAILRRKVPVERIAQRDTKSYFGVLLDDNNRQPICRLHFNRDKKYIGLFDEDKNETREHVETVDDIYKFEEQLLQTVDYYGE